MVWTSRRQFNPRADTIKPRPEPKANSSRKFAAYEKKNNLSGKFPEAAFGMIGILGILRLRRRMRSDSAQDDSAENAFPNNKKGAASQRRPSVFISVICVNQW
jgi:hypothetical protein